MDMYVNRIGDVYNKSCVVNLIKQNLNNLKIADNTPIYKNLLTGRQVNELLEELPNAINEIPSYKITEDQILDTINKLAVRILKRHAHNLINQGIIEKNPRLIIEEIAYLIEDPQINKSDIPTNPESLVEAAIIHATIRHLKDMIIHLLSEINLKQCLMVFRLDGAMF